MPKMIGISRPLRIEWLDMAAETILRNRSEAESREAVNEYVAREIESPTNRRKTREILVNIWVRENAEIKNIRKKAMIAYPKSGADRMALHWCMILLAYPFYYDVSCLIGKLARIQDTFSVSWMKEKMFEKWGERTALGFAVEKMLQTLKQCNIVKSEGQGVYSIMRTEIKSADTLEVMLMTIFHLDKKAYHDIFELSRAPMMFPFDFEVTHEWIYQTDGVRLHNFGGKVAVVYE